MYTKNEMEYAEYKVWLGGITKMTDYHIKKMPKDYSSLIMTEFNLTESQTFALVNRVRQINKLKKIRKIIMFAGVLIPIFIYFIHKLFYPYLINTYGNYTSSNIYGILLQGIGILSIPIAIMLLFTVYGKDEIDRM